MNSISYKLQDVLKKQKAELRTLQAKHYVKRDKEEELKRNINNSLIKILIGPRRAGKSRLIQKVLEGKEVAYLNFEEELFQISTGNDIISAAEKIYPKAEYWYLDEIQDFPQWEIFVNKLHRRSYNLFITGSNAKLLSTEIASSLTGRHVAIELLPFSYGEFLLAKQMNRSWETYKEYLDTGGFPEVVIENLIDKKNYLKTLFDSIILKDLVRRKKIRNPVYLSNTVALICNNITARTSARSLSKALQSTPSPTTVEKYIQYLTEAFLIESTKQFSFKTKEQIQGERKPYLIDTGLISAISNGILENKSKQLENSIFLELRRQGYETEFSLFHYRMEDKKEIDFLIRNGHKTSTLIQVCYDISSIETQNRETSALKNAKRIFNEANLQIITAKESGEIKIDKNITIKLIPAYEYCK